MPSPTIKPKDQGRFGDDVRMQTYVSPGTFEKLEFIGRRYGNRWQSLVLRIIIEEWLQMQESKTSPTTSPPVRFSRPRQGLVESLVRDAGLQEMEIEHRPLGRRRKRRRK